MNREAGIKLAASLPKGDPLRREILAALKTSARGSTWFAYLQEVQQAFISDILGQATAILKSNVASGIREGKNYLEFQFPGKFGSAKGSLIFMFYGTDGKVKWQTSFGGVMVEDIRDVTTMDPKGVALWALYAEHRGAPVLPI